MYALHKSATLFFLYCYVSSLMVGAIPYVESTSFSFVFGGLYIFTKLTDCLYQKKWPAISIIVYVIVLLYLYLTVSERLLHDQSILNTHHISFGLNCLMLALVVDEFSSNFDVMEMSMWLYCAAAVVIAVLMALNIFTSISDSSRVTFLQQNENEISAGLLVAFVLISLAIRSDRSQSKIRTAVFMVSGFFTLNAIIVTGTRFAILAAFFVVILLGALRISSKTNVRRSLIYSASCITFMIVRVVSFSPASERFSLHVQGNNLADLGGRIPLWRTSIDAFFDSPWLGMGYSGFKQFVMVQQGYSALPHNFLLTVAATGGVVGLLLILIIVYLVVKRILYFGSKELFSDLFIFLIPLAAMLMMLNVFHLKLFWLLLAYLIASLYPTPITLRSQHH